MMGSSANIVQGEHKGMAALCLYSSRCASVNLLQSFAIEMNTNFFLFFSHLRSTRFQRHRAAGVKYTAVPIRFITAFFDIRLGSITQHRDLST